MISYFSADTIQEIMNCQTELNEIHNDLCNACKKNTWYIVLCALIIIFSLVTIILGGYIVTRIDSESRVGWGLFQTGIIFCLFITVFYLLPEFLRIVMNLLYPIRVKPLKTRLSKRHVVEQDIEMGLPERESPLRSKRIKELSTGNVKSSPKLKGIQNHDTNTDNSTHRERSNSNRSRSNSEIAKIKKIATEIVKPHVDPPAMTDNPMRKSASSSRL